MWDQIGLWLSAFMTIAVWSFAIPGENKVYRVAEYTMIGVAAGYSLAQGVRVVMQLGFTPLMGGQSLLIIPILFGLLIFTQVSSKYRYLSRWPMALLIGSGVGVSIRTTPEVNIMRQITATFLPIFGVEPFQGFSNLVLIVACISALAYFYMTFEMKGPVGGISQLGRYSIMILLGATWGSQLMIRATIFIGRLTFLIRDFFLVVLS